MVPESSPGSRRRWCRAGTEPGERRAAPALAAARSSHEAAAPAHARRDGVPLGLRRAGALPAVTRASRTCSTWAGQRFSVSYLPAESDTGLFGGNSNWRGPIWFPVNYLLIESLQKFHHYYGDDFKVECPTGSGKLITIEEVADELSRRLTRIFLRDEQGRRAVFGASAEAAGRPALPRSPAVLRVLPRRQRPRRRRLAPDRLDRPGRQAPATAPAWAEASLNGVRSRRLRWQQRV